VSSATVAPAKATFKSRFVSNDVLLGTFIKTPTLHATEILGIVGFDFVVIDEEHAPFDRNAIDTVLCAARGAGIAGLVRVSSADPAPILSALDCGATGVLVPHVATAEMARDVVAACRHRGGKRGYSTSPRAGRYGGVSMIEHIENLDAQTLVLAMIEDPEALDVIDEIAATEGLDGVFIGRGDLMVSLGAPNNQAPIVKQAVDKIVAAMKKVNKPVMVMVGGLEEAREFHANGVKSFIVSSDQGLMRRAATQVLTGFSELGRPHP